MEPDDDCGLIGPGFPPTDRLKYELLRLYDAFQARGKTASSERCLHACLSVCPDAELYLVSKASGPAKYVVLYSSLAYFFPGVFTACITTSELDTLSFEKCFWVFVVCFCMMGAVDILI